MMGLLQYEWKDPWFFIFLAVIPWLAYNIIKKQKTSHFSLDFSKPENFGQQYSWKIYFVKAVPFMYLLALAFIIIAMARPQSALREEQIKGEGISIMLTMDLSSSMLSQDFDPNRLEASKKVAIDFVQKRKYDKIGIVGFSGEGYTQCPLTTDRFILTQLLNQMHCGVLEDGTAIGLGLATAINRLKNDSTKSKVIILLTDGVNNAGNITPQLAAEIAMSYGIKIYSIGVGTNGEAYSPIGRNVNGDFVFGMAPVNIDENLLHEISTKTGGKYYRATSIEELKTIYNEIDLLEKTKLDIKIYKRYTEEFRPFIVFAFIILLLAWFIKNYFVLSKL